MANLSFEQLQQCIVTLQELASHPHRCIQKDTAERQVVDAAALLLRRLKAEQKRQRRVRDQEVIDESTIRHQRQPKGIWTLSDCGRSVADIGCLVGQTT